MLTFVWDGICRALVAFMQDMNLPNPDQIQEAINNSNVELAKRIIKKYGIDFDISNLDQEALFEDGYISFGENRVRRAKKIKDFAADPEFLDRIRDNGPIQVNAGIIQQINEADGINPIANVFDEDEGNDVEEGPWGEL